MNMIHTDIWLYGPLAQYGGSDDNVFAHITPEFPEGTTVRGLLASLNLPTEQRGISFINNSLSAMPGLQPDLDYVLKDGDRLAFFHLKSMWPCQYRSGVMMLPELTEAMAQREDKGLQSDFTHSNC